MINEITEIWNKLDAENTGIEEAEEWISDTTDKIMKNNEVEQKKEELWNVRIDLGTQWLHQMS